MARLPDMHNKTSPLANQNWLNSQLILSLDDARKLIHAFIFSRLDYCNAMYTGLPKGCIAKLQLIQNEGARVLLKILLKGESISHQF